MTTITPKMHEQPQRDALILSYLNSVDSLLRHYAASTRLDYDDLRHVHRSSLLMPVCSNPTHGASTGSWQRRPWPLLP